MFALVLFFLVFGFVRNETTVEAIHKALSKSVKFITEDYKNVNIDGIFSLALAYGTLNVPPQNTQQGFVDELKKDLLEAYQLIYPTIPNEGFDKYFKKYLLDLDMWTRPTTYGSFELNTNLTVYPGKFDLGIPEGFYGYLSASEFKGNISDECLVEILSVSDRRTKHFCPISLRCKEFFLSNVDGFDPLWMGYGVTHRLLYIQTARARNCIVDEEIVKSLIEEYCSYIYWELRMNQFHGLIPTFDDLFMEQIALCGREGFKEFFDEEFLEHILDVAHISGCFGSRRRRYTFEMSYKCSSHTTGVAIVALTEFLLHELEKLEILYN